MEPIPDPSEMLDFQENYDFYQSMVRVIELLPVDVVSKKLHQIPDLFECLKAVLLEDLGPVGRYDRERRVLGEIIDIYSCIGVFAPRVAVLLRYSIIFLVNGLASKGTDKLHRRELDDKDVKRLKAAYTTVILNITTNPKVWIGSGPTVTLVDWTPGLEKKEIDRETFVALRSFLKKRF
jgi:hypothetical protein